MLVPSPAVGMLYISTVTLRITNLWKKSTKPYYPFPKAGFFIGNPASVVLKK